MWLPTGAEVIDCESVVWSSAQDQEVSSGHSANEQSSKLKTDFVLGFRVWCKRRRFTASPDPTSDRDVIHSRTFAPKDENETQQQLLDRVNSELTQKPLRGKRNMFDLSFFLKICNPHFRST